MNSKYAPLAAEFFGTATLVFVGCGAVTFGNYGQSMPLGIFPIAFAFGGVLIGLIYALGPISGCHINPAVTLAAWVGGRFEKSKVAGYIAAQCAGAIIASVLLVAIFGLGTSEEPINLGSNGWGEGYLGEYSVVAAFLVEFIATFMFVVVILGSTSSAANSQFAGVAIGMTLIVLLITFVNVTGSSLNPARSIGPALFSGTTAIGQLWLFIFAPSLGGLLAGLLCRSGFFDKPTGT